MVLTDVFSMGYFQSILGFWQSKRRIIIQVQLMHYNYRLKIMRNEPKLRQFWKVFWEGTCPHTSQLNRPFGLIFATGWSLTVRS